MKKICCCITLLLFIPVSSISQVNIVFVDDTAFYIKPSFYSPITFGVDFKDELNDGQWIMYDLHRKDSAKISENYLILTGVYKNGKREGIFNYYARRFLHNKRKKSYEMYVQYSKSYKNGILDGLMFYNPGNGVVKETMYFNGKKDGIDVVYNQWAITPRDLLYINHYNQDTLISWREYLQTDKNRLLGIGLRHKEGEYTYTKYNKDGSLDYVVYFKNFIFYKYEKYSSFNQLLKKEAEGIFSIEFSIKERLADFGNPYTFSPYRFYLNIDSFELIKGIERKYNEKGELIYEKKL